METSISRLLELAKVPTIASATERSGNINRKTADRILDPQGYFEKNKHKLGHKVTEDDRRPSIRDYLTNF